MTTKSIPTIRASSLMIVLSYRTKWKPELLTDSKQNQIKLKVDVYHLVKYPKNMKKYFAARSLKPSNIHEIVGSPHSYKL